MQSAAQLPAQLAVQLAVEMAGPEGRWRRRNGLRRPHHLAAVQLAVLQLAVQLAVGAREARAVVEDEVEKLNRRHGTAGPAPLAY